VDFGVAFGVTADCFDGVECSCEFALLVRANFGGVMVLRFNALALTFAWGLGLVRLMDGEEATSEVEVVLAVEDGVLFELDRLGVDGVIDKILGRDGEPPTSFFGDWNGFAS